MSATSFAEPAPNIAELPPAVEALRARTRAFIREVVMPAEPRPGERLEEDVRRALGEQAKDAGVFAPQVPAAHGGLGLPIEYWSPVFQEAGYSPIGPAVINCMAPDEGNMHMLHLIGSEDQKSRYLDPLARGEIRSSFAMTEPHPGAGSDPSALRTEAIWDGKGWTITGHKRFISGAELADVIIVMARTTGEDGAEGATMFLVDRDAPGLRLGESIHTVDRTIAGGHPHLHFDGVRVGPEAVLGAAGEGFRYAQVRLAPARLTHCMRWLGLARRSLDIALDRAEHRELFGDRLSQLGIAQELIAASVIDIETSDAIIASAARFVEHDARAAGAMSSIAKVHCSEAVYRVIDRAVQLCGGDGVSDQLPLIQYLNEVRPFRIYDGSNEAHKWAIAKRASSARRRAVAAGELAQDGVSE